jgi:hypothetical protein
MNSIVDDIVGSIVDGVVSEWKRRNRKRRRRRSRKLTPTERLRRIEKLLKPASRQTSRRKSTRSRSTAQRRRLKATTRKHRKSLRRGAARR